MTGSLPWIRRLRSQIEQGTQRDGVAVSDNEAQLAPIRRDPPFGGEKQFDC
jgi:hypothetical protein